MGAVIARQRLVRAIREKTKPSQKDHRPHINKVFDHEYCARISLYFLPQTGRPDEKAAK
jgi:hypothetical protein